MGYYCIANKMRSCRVLWLLAVLLLFPATAFSLDNNYWSTGLNFHFYPPGARSLGMGGAFVGLADDATAAVSNPAGIAQLNRMQLAIEGRYMSTDDKEASSFFRGPLGSATGPMQINSEQDDVTEVSFGAFSMPVLNNLFNLAVFYDKPMSFSSKKSIAFPDVGLFQYNGFGSLFTQYQNVNATTDISIDEVGISLAKSFADGRLMLGFGLGAQFFDYQGRLNFSDKIRFLAPPDIELQHLSAKTDGNDIGLSCRVGVLAKPIDQLRLGFSYTRMPNFDADIHTSLSLFNRIIRLPTEEYQTSFNVPDNFAFGAAYNIFPNWVAVFEAKYVMYSQLMDRFTSYQGYQDDVSNEGEFSMSDAMEIHFGTEYVLNAIPNVPIALRAGFFFEPAHDLKYDGTNQIEKRLFDGGKDLWHFTVGTGLVLFNHYQIDVGGDFTEDSRNVGLSMVYQF